MVSAYHATSANKADGMDEHPMSYWAALAEQRIAAARDRGEFDDLPGAGKPLNLDDDAHVPPELRLAWKLLKNAGFAPPELEARKEINGLLDLLEQGGDEAETLRRMRRLDVLLLKSACRRCGPVTLDAADPYYDQVVRRVSVLRRKAPPRKDDTH